jgi:DNA-binding XRE family transcriptional regulator
MVRPQDGRLSAEQLTARNYAAILRDMPRTKLTPTQFNRFRLDLSPMAARRRFLGMSQGQLGRAIGVHRETVGRNSTEPTLSQMLAASRALGTPLHQLFTVVE